MQRALLDRVLAALRAEHRAEGARLRAYEVLARSFERALRRALDGRLDAPARAVFARFAEPFSARPSPAGLRRVLPLVRARLDDVARLARRREHGLRHAAIYLLGESRDARAARPILDAFLNQKHWRDHDYLFAACPLLGRAGTRAFERIAREDPDPRRRSAATCLLFYCVNSFGALRRVGALAITSENDGAPVCNVRDRRVLVELTPAILHGDHGLRQHALWLADVLSAPDIPGRLTGAERRALCDALAVAADDRVGGNAGPALALLGRMRDARHTPRLFAAARDVVDDVAHGAIRGLGAWATPAARRALVALLDDPSPERACRAALALAEGGRVDARVRPRVRALLAQLATTFDDYFAYDAFRVLWRTPAGVRALAAVANDGAPAVAARVVRSLADATVTAARRCGRDRMARVVAAALRPEVRRAYLRECLRAVRPSGGAGPGSP